MTISRIEPIPFNAHFRGGLILLVCAIALLANGCTSKAICVSEYYEEEFRREGLPYTRHDGYFEVDAKTWHELSRAYEEEMWRKNSEERER